jgi:hypothetical protein
MKIKSEEQLKEDIKANVEREMVELFDLKF